MPHGVQSSFDIHVVQVSRMAGSKHTGFPVSVRAAPLCTGFGSGRRRRYVGGGSEQ